MRLAGCERLSLGVESGSQAILDAIDKKITPDEIIASTELAKKYGIKVRYYMMVGNRGETRATFDETLRLLERAKPHQYIFAALSVYPGTRDYDLACEAGWLDPEFYFESDFQELKTTFDASDEDTAFFRDWFNAHKGLHEPYREGVAEYRAILGRLGDHAPAHMDLSSACFREGQLDEAEVHARRALELGYPLPGLALNTLACVAARRGDLPAMNALLAEASQRDPQHWVLEKNLRAVREGRLGELDVRSEFQLLERPAQPTLPGPLPADFAVWGPSPAPPSRPIGGRREGGAPRLRVVSA